MLSKKQLLEINRRMIALGEPNVRDFMGYNKPDFTFCHRFLSNIDDYDAYLLSKRLKKYIKTQLIDYDKEIKETIKAYDKIYKKNRNLSFERNKNKKFVDVSFEENFVYIYTPIIPIELSYHYEYEEKGSKIIKVKYNKLFSVLKILNSCGLTIKRNVWKEVKNRKLETYSIFEDILFINKNKKRKEKKLIEKNKKLTKGNTYIINIIEDNKELKTLQLEYPRNKSRSKDIIYQILKSLSYEDRIYFGDQNQGDFKLRYSGVKSFLSLINKFNKSQNEIQINANCLNNYIEYEKILKISVAYNNLFGDCYKLDFQYNKDIIEIIKSLPNISRKFVLNSWFIDKNMLSKLYILLIEIEYNNFKLDLSDFEKYIDIDKLNSNDITIKLEYISGIGTNTKYIISFEPYNEDIYKVLLKYSEISYENSSLNIYISEFPKLIEEFENLKNYNFNIEILKETYNTFEKGLYNKVFPIYPLDKINKTLYPYQIEGVKEMLSKKRMLLCDEMGLGKTLQFIVWGLSYPYKKLVIVPKCLKLNWEKEIKEVDPSQEVVVIDTKYKSLSGNGWVIINYDILNKYKTELENENFKVVGLDEAHFIKSVKTGGIPSSNRAKTSLDLIKNIPFRAVITGTPIQNKNKDLWNLLVAIEHPIARNFFNFAYEYCNAEKTQFGFIFDGSSNTSKLNSKLKPYMIRRLKNEVLDLPEKIRTFIPNKINLTKYNKKLSEYLEECNGFLSSGQHLVYLNALRYIIAQEKVKSTIEIAENILEQNEQVVIFTNYTEPLNNFLDYFGENAIAISGKTSEKDRLENVRKFQNGEVKVFIGNIKAAGVGITLTKAANLIFNDYDWIPSNHTQAEDRLHRISQSRVSNIYYNYAHNTEIDVDITDLLNKKLKNISSIIDGKTEEFVNYSMFNDIVKKYSKNIEKV